MFAIVVAVLLAAEPSLADAARAVLARHCHRCHGQDGSVEGGFNHVLDLAKLTARRKVVPGDANGSPLLRRVVSGKMPPPDVQPRPSPEEIAALRRWIDAGAPTDAAPPRPPTGDVAALVLADVQTLDRRMRRFVRYFSLVEVADAGLGEDELQTYRNALAKLVNSLSWHPRLAKLTPVDPRGLVLRLDLRDVVWDANLWNRLLAEYPYGVVGGGAAARAVAVHTGTRLPWVRGDWFVASASRAPLYYDLLQMPNSASELEAQLRVDVAANLRQERVARAGFNGSGIARNNRLLERHDAAHGAYWRSYDFDAVPPAPADRANLLPDRRNLFAYPLGPAPFAPSGRGLGGEAFQHAGGEVIFHLPNGLQAYLLVDARNRRVDKAPTAIVGDPKRPDKAVEAGVSCIGCHYRGINPKDDQIRDYVAKNPQAFARADAALVRALYPPAEKMRALMDEDAERFRAALDKTGNKVSAFEPILTLTLRYEGDLDLTTAAAELGVKEDLLRERVGQSESAARNLGALRVAGGTVARPVFVQAFADLVRELRTGTPLDPAATPLTTDAVGDVDPLEAQSSPANGAAFTPDGRLALLASRDRTVRIVDVASGRDLRRLVGHTASVWSVAIAADGRTALTGGADATVRLWDVTTGREVRRLDGHEGVVAALAVAADGRRALSAGYDDMVVLWDLETGRPLHTWEGRVRDVHAVALSPDGRFAAIAAEKTIRLWDVATGEEAGRLDGHAGLVAGVAVAADGKTLVSGGDDGTVRVWDVTTRREVRRLARHDGPVRCVAFSPDGRQIVSGGADATLRLWDTATGREGKRFTRHSDALVAATFVGAGRTLSASRDGAVRFWDIVPPETPIVPLDRPPGAPRSVAVVPVDGLVAALIPSADGKAFTIFDTTEAQALRFDVATGRRLGELRLRPGTTTLVASPDGKTLYAPAPDGAATALQVLDAATTTLRTIFTVPIRCFDAAAGGDRVFLSGADGDWTDVVAVDAKGGAVVGRWGGVWRRSFLGATADGGRLYHATQGVTPNRVLGLTVPKEASRRAEWRGTSAVGGAFLLTAEGRHLLFPTGTVLRLAAERDDDLKPAAAVEPFVAAAALATGVFLLGGDGTLTVRANDDLRVLATHRLDVLGYRAAGVASGTRLFVAAVDAKALTGRPARVASAVHVFDLVQK